MRTVLLFLLLPCSILAQSTLSVGRVRGAPNVSAPVPLHFRGSNIVALQADLVFDPALLMPASVSGGGAAANHVVASAKVGSGVQRVLLYLLQNTPFTNGVLATIPFTVSASVRNSVIPIGISNVVMATREGNGGLSINRGGLVVIHPVFIHPDGTAQLFLSVLPNTSYAVQASTNLIDWFNLGTSTPATGILEFFDTNAPAFPFRFYRAKSVP